MSRWHQLAEDSLHPRHGDKDCFPYLASAVRSNLLVAPVFVGSGRSVLEGVVGSGGCPSFLKGVLAKYRSSFELD
jgi:hypothetical protein